MVLSCLVEPLVSPLVGQGISGRRRTALLGTRLLSTALALTALSTVAGMAEAEEIAAHAKTEEARVAPNAHKKPDPVPYRVLLQTEFLLPHANAEIQMPEESPWFENKAHHAHRLKDERDIRRAQGPRFGHLHPIDHLYGGGSSTSLRI
jgi:hypothetical protein